MLIDRNDELCILYEKANTQEEVMRKGVLQFLVTVAVCCAQSWCLRPCLIVVYFLAGMLHECREHACCAMYAQCACEHLLCIFTPLQCVYT